MPGWLCLLYGGIAYAIGLAALACFIAFGGFGGDLLGLPRTVDTGPSTYWAEALLRDLSLIVLFGLQHSVMARPGFKRWWTRLVPAAIERSTYLLATSLALAALMAFWLPIPAPVLWRVDDPRWVAAVWGLFGLGWALVVASSYLINHFELFGLQQVWRRFRQRPALTTAFHTPWLYRLVRHPLYLGILIGLWAVPVMSAGHVVLSIGMSLYILVGISFEERDLVRQFGERYRQYREQVGMLLPRLRSPAGSTLRSSGRSSGPKASAD